MRYRWFKRLHLCACVVLCAIQTPALARDDDKYASPDGEDTYGPRFEAKEIPPEVRDFLDSDCEYAVPSFIDLTIMDEGLECWVIDQNPAPGTVLSGPQTVTVHLTYTSDGLDERFARLPIQLFDIAPPSIDVILDSNVEPEPSFGGIPRFVSPAGGAIVVPIVTVSDACDQNPTTQVFLDGEQYILGTAVTSLGIHLISVSTQDAHGNANDTVFVFEIRQRPSFAAVAVVQDSQCEISPDGQTGFFDATVLIADDEIDHHNILLSSVRLFLRDADGNYLNPIAIPIAGGFVGECPIFQHLDAEAEINECWLALRLEGQFVPAPGGACPVGFDIVGVGVSATGDLTFDWGASTDNQIDPTPVATLIASAGKIEPCNSVQPIPPQPQPSCQQVETSILTTGVCVAGPVPPTGLGCTGTAWSNAGASSAVSGNSLSTAFAPAWPIACTASSWCSAGGSLVIIEQLLNCCNCAITFNANAGVSAFASVSGFGTWNAGASATGSISFFAPCGSGIASATNSANPTTPSPAAVTGTGGINCTDNACTSFLIVAGNVEVTTNVSSVAGIITWPDNSTTTVPADATAKARVTTPNITINTSATGTPCPPDPCDP